MIAYNDVLAKLEKLLLRLDALESRIDWIEEHHGARIEEVNNTLTLLETRMEEL